MLLKVGNRVKGKEGILGISGKVGTVMYTFAGTFDYGVQFDEPIKGGHNIGDSSKYKNGHCRWVSEAEIESLPYFADARAGDSVYSMVCGDGTIIAINRASMHPLKVAFPNGDRVDYVLEGYDHIPIPIQSLFYSKPIFDLPPPPKRKIKKVLEGWVNIYERSMALNLFSLFYSTRTAADSGANTDRLGEAHFIHHEYEVEE